ncbi:MAG: hypothetical protein ACF8XB_11015 [Planctomycetota bacterium JB042]
MKFDPISMLAPLALAALAPALPAADFVGASYATKELYRVDTQTGQTSLIGPYQTVDANEYAIPCLARATDGTLYGVSGSQLTSRVYRFDEQTGAATPVTALTFAPVTPVAASIDPTDGSLYFSNTYGFVPWPSVEKVDLQTGQQTYFGQIAPTGEQYNGFAFDPSGQLYSLNLTQNALWRVDKNNPANSTIVGTGLGGGVDLSQGGSLAYDVAAATMFGYEYKTQRFFTIDLNTGLANLVGAAPILPLFSDFATDACTGSTLPYGAACVGQGGFAPELSLGGCPADGQQVVLTLSDAPGPSTANFFLGATTASIPVGGCDFLVAPILIAATIPLGGSGPGTGSLTLPGVIPPGSAGASFTMQAWVTDPTSSVGWNGTNGLQVTVGA